MKQESISRPARPSPHPVDQADMYGVLRDFPRQFPESVALPNVEGALPADLNVTGAVIGGMGGSALAGDILCDFLGGSFPLRIVRDYVLPPGLGADTLVLACSYSGNTEESLELYDSARAAGSPMIALTSGGRLRERAARDGVPSVLIPGGMQPRSALGHFFAATYALLVRYRLIREDRRVEVAALAEDLAGPAHYEDRAQGLARLLEGFVPIVYSSAGYRSVARIWKIKFNENAKIPSFHNELPELNHNEMIGFTQPLLKAFIVFLIDPEDHRGVRKRVAVLEELFGERGIPCGRVEMEGSNKLQKIFRTLYLGDWVSYFLALRYGVDPTPVPMVENFKARLAALGGS